MFHSENHCFKLAAIISLDFSFCEHLEHLRTDTLIRFDALFTSYMTHDSTLPIFRIPHRNKCVVALVRKHLEKSRTFLLQ